MELYGSKVYLVNNTISDNEVYAGTAGSAKSTGGGLFFDTADEAWAPSDVMITNSIVYGNHSPSTGAADIANVISNSGNANGSHLGIDHTDFHTLKSHGTDVVHPEINHELREDPKFSHHPLTLYHLTSASPCIDQGDNLALSIPAEDLAGHKRILDGNGDGLATVDMGSYEALEPFSWPMFIPALISGSKR